MKKALLYARRGSATMISKSEWAPKNLETISANSVPDVPMIFFTAKEQASATFPDNPEKYFELARNYTNNQAIYIELDCGHYVHVEKPGIIAEKIQNFVEELHTD